MFMNKLHRAILIAAALSMSLVAAACSKNNTTTATSTVTVTASPTTSSTTAPLTTVSGNVTVNIADNAFQPSMMTARVGTTVNFYNMMGPLTLVGNSGFMMGAFGGMMMQTGGSYQYTFNSPGSYVVSATGQSYICTITIVS